LRNLVSNAVRVALKDPAPSLVIHKKIHERRVELRITNNGVPIPEDLKDRVLNEVILDGQLQQGGHGTGLWIGRRIIRRHLGDLDLVSSDESGTTFLLWLPLAEQPVEKGEPVYESL
jgi:signal transduction histidine kinase